MKCPKCGYLGFEHVERCRNCGYDFLLSRSVGFPELTIRPEARDPNPLADLALVDRTPPIDPERFASEMDSDLDRLLATTAPPFADVSVAAAPGVAPSVAPVARAAPAARAVSAAPVAHVPRVAAAAPSASTSAVKMPLFASARDDAPLITKAPPPRQPLAVRRSTPEAPRLRAGAPRAASFDLPLDSVESAPAAVKTRPAADAVRPEWQTPDQAHTDDTASVGARITAVFIDLLILATIDAAVLYFTMQICAVGLNDLAIVPKGPLVAFLLVQNGGYLVAFTVGGQTLGKMAAGIKVVAAESDANLEVGRALLRTAVWILLAVPAGLGFITAFFTRDHRGLHDRFARTRVVRASAW